MRRSFYAAAVAIALAGCASVDNSPIGDGRYMRGLNSEGTVLVQVDLPSSTACRMYAGNARRIAAKQPPDGSRIVCSDFDVAPNLAYRGAFEDQLDGAIWIVTARTEALCEVIGAGFLRTDIGVIDRKRFKTITPCQRRA